VPDVDAFDIVLDPAATLTGKVTERGTGRPLPGFDVRAKIDRDPPAFGSAVTDARGVYAIASLPSGQVGAVHVSGPGHAQELPEAPASWIRPQLLPGAATVLDIELVPTGAMHGTVRGPDGPIAGLLVEAVCMVMYHELPAFTARTDEHGAYGIGNLPPARYLVRVDTFRLHEPGSAGDPLNPFESFQPGSSDQLVLVPSGGDVERSFALEQNTAVIEGRVEDSTGRGLARATVAAAGAKTESGPSGSFRLEGCRPGERVFVSAGLEGFRLTGISFVTLRPYETTGDVLLRVEPAVAREVVGRIHPADGVALREPYVLVTDIRERKISSGNEPTRHAAAPDGTFRVALNEWGWPELTAVSLRAGDIGEGLSEPVRVQLAGPARYEADLFLGPSHCVAGVVVGDDGKAVPGACVSLFPPREDVMRDQFRDPHANAPVVAVTGADGTFEARGLAAGRFWWRVWAPGLSDSCGEVAVPAAEPMRIALVRALEIGGRVVTRDGKPVGSIHVTIQLPLPMEGNWGDAWWRHDLHRIHNLCANERGEFRLGGLRRGDYRINVGGGSGGPNVVSKAFAGIPAGSTDLELVVEPGLSIQGRVVGTKGQGLEDVYVMARIEGKEMVGDSRRSDRTAPDGGFVITGLEAGLYSIWLDVQRGNARRQITREHFVAGSSDVVIDVDDTFATVSGTLVDGAGKPFAGVRLRLVEGGRWTDSVAFTDAAGMFSFEGAGQGEYQVEVDRDERFEGLLLEGGESVTGGDTGVALRLHEGAPIEGVVRDEEGALLADVWVGATAGEVSRAAKTDAHGRFRIVGVPEGVEARVRAAHKDFAAHLRRVPTGTSGVTITLLRGTVTTGRLVDAASGSPLKGLRLRFTPVEGDDTEALARTDDDGRFTSRLLARDYRVTAERVGVEAAPSSCGVLRGGAAEVTLTAR